MREVAAALSCAAAIVLLMSCGERQAATAQSSLQASAPAMAAESAPPDPAPAAQASATAQTEAESPGKSLLTYEERGLPPELAPLQIPWTGDFDTMVERRVVRVLTVFQVGSYFLDGPQEKGMTYDLVKMFETFLNERLGTGHVKLHVVLIPVEFDQLLDALVAGYGDIAAAGLSITPEREEIVDFGTPLSREVKEIVVTGPAAPELGTIGDLSGQSIYVKPGSSYRASLESLNRRFEAEGRAPVEIIDAPSLLQDTDLLEMVAAGLWPMVAMDNYKAGFWTGILDGLTVRNDLVIQDGRQIAWAIRKDSPLLKAEVDEFSRTHRQGTLMGNILIKRYLKNSGWVKNALDPDELDRFEATVMQLLQSTAEDPNVGIPDIEQVEPNIHAGVKYLRFLRDRYFDDPELDAFNRALFSFAAYNAGPARVRGLRRKAAEAGLDPDKWFNNVELIAAREIGRETVQYVSNIYKYYLAYTLITEKMSQHQGQPQ
jgi:membrane-bound lytic murein transglycosylase MltF